MVEHSEHYSERTLAELLDDLVPEANVFIVFNIVFLLVIIKSMVRLFVNYSVDTRFFGPMALVLFFLTLR